MVCHRREAYVKVAEWALWKSAHRTCTLGTHIFCCPGMPATRHPEMTTSAGFYTGLKPSGRTQPFL
jgi:hypothetical protein